MPDNLLCYLHRELRALEKLIEGPLPLASHADKRAALKSVRDMRERVWNAGKDVGAAPAEPCFCDKQGIGEPGVSCGDCPTRDYGAAPTKDDDALTVAYMAGFHDGKKAAPAARPYCHECMAPVSGPCAYKDCPVAAPAAPGHSWHDAGQIGGRNVSWCSRCDTIAFTGHEPDSACGAASCAAAPAAPKPLTEEQLLEVFATVDFRCAQDAAVLRKDAEGCLLDPIEAIGARHSWRAFERAARAVEAAHGITSAVPATKGEVGNG